MIVWSETRAVCMLATGGGVVMVHIQQGPANFTVVPSCLAWQHHSGCCSVQPQTLRKCYNTKMKCVAISQILHQQNSMTFLWSRCMISVDSWTLMCILFTWFSFKQWDVHGSPLHDVFHPPIFYYCAFGNNNMCSGFIFQSVRVS